MSTSPDYNFDTACVRLAGMCAGGALPQGLRASEWEAIVERSVRHRVAPLLYSRLGEDDEVKIPNQAMSALRGHVQANAAGALSLAGQMRRILTSFAEAKIPVIVFKGIALSASLYDDVSMRDVGDLDLLVHHGDIVRAADLLVAAGHAPFFPTATARESSYLAGLKGRARRAYLESHCEHHLVHHASYLNVDLHWAFSLREFAVSLDPDELWARAAMQCVAGFNVQTPGPADMLLILCLNGSKDRWERLDRICDIAALVRQLSDDQWLEVFKLAAESGMARMLAIGLLLAESILHSVIPADALQHARDDGRAVEIARDVRSRLLGATQANVPAKALGFRFDLQMRERFSDRLRYVAAHLRPGVGDWAAVPLPAPLAPLHYLIRPFRLITRYGLS